MYIMLSRLVEQTRDFLSKPFNLYLVLALLVLGTFAFISQPAPAPTPSEDKLAIHFFFSPSCSHCAEQKIFNEELKNEFPEIEVLSHDITLLHEYGLLETMAQNHSIDPSTLGTPTTFIGNEVIIGFKSAETTGVEIREAILRALDDSQVSASSPEPSRESLLQEMDLPFFGKTDLSTLSLPILAVTLGLIDGFNPCAMWVLVYLIALLMGLGDRKKMAIIVGTFVLASGILYFLFMTAWLNVFIFIGYIRIVTILVGLVALGGGVLSVKSYLEQKDAMVCKVTDKEEKKKIMTDIKALISAPFTWATFLAIIILAFTVNSIEFLCSFGIPAVFTQILALSNLSTLEHYFYIALYDIFFMLDDAIIFGLAVFTLSGISGEKYSKYCKLVGGIVLLVLGIMLLFAPELLQ